MAIYNKSLKNLRVILQKLIDKGYVARRSKTLYGTHHYSSTQKLLLESNDLVSLIEGRDMGSGDYYIASLTNLFRQELLNGNKKLTLSAADLLHRLRFGKSKGTVRNRISDLVRSKIITPKLVGRIYSYELNSDILLNTRTPETIDEQSNRLSELFQKHLIHIGQPCAKDEKMTFSRMLFDGYDYMTIAHIIAYLGQCKNRYTEVITKAAHIRKRYEELYDESYRALSKRKGVRYLYKLVNGLLWKTKPVLPVETPIKSEPKVLTDSYIWGKVQLWGNTLKRSLGSFACKYGYAVEDLESADIYNEALLKMYMMVQRNGCCPFVLNSSSLLGSIRSYISKHRTHLCVAEYNDEITASESQSALIDYTGREVKSEYKHIPQEAMDIVCDILGRDGRKYTQREIATKYSLSLSKVNRLYNKYIDEIKRIAFGDPPNIEPAE